MRLPLLLAASVAASATPALSQTIVGDGEDLQAAIDAATSGDVIEIQSDGTFAGIRIANKSLTVRAGAGFTPEITGPGQFTPLALVVGSGQPGDTSSVTLEGLTFVGAQTVAALDNAPAGATQTLTVTFDDCVLAGGFASFEAPDRTLDLTFVDSVVRPVDLLAPLAAGSSVEIASTVVLGAVEVFSGGSVTISDSTLANSVVAEGVDGLPTSVELRRSTVAGGLELRSVTNGPVSGLVESSLFDFVAGAGSGAAFNVRQSGAATSLRLVNGTVRNYDFGLGAQGGALIEVENSIFDGNTTDLLLLGTDPASVFRNSIFPDGSFDGVNGNTQTPAVFGCGSELVASTGGVDAGDSLVADLGTTDLFGAPRVQDGDGTPVVNLGAVESLADFGAQAVLFNGSGVNPVDMTAVTPPALGTVFDLTIALDAGTVATVAQVDLPSAAPFPNPVGSGEVFLQLSGAAIGDFQVPGGAHSFALPPNLGLLGNTLRVQGFRVSLSPVLQVDALNAFEMVFGSCP